MGACIKLADKNILKCLYIFQNSSANIHPRFLLDVSIKKHSISKYLEPIM